MVCDLNVKVPGFSGAFRCCVWDEDLKAFRSQLLNMRKNIGHACTASFLGTEQGIGLRFDMDANGLFKDIIALKT